MQLLATCVNDIILWEDKYSTYCDSHMRPASQTTLTFVVRRPSMAGYPCNRMPGHDIKGPDHNDVNSLNV